MLDFYDFKTIGKALCKESYNPKNPRAKKFQVLGCMYLMKYALKIPITQSREKIASLILAASECFNAGQAELAFKLAKEGMRYRPSVEEKQKLNAIIKLASKEMKKIA